MKINHFLNTIYIVFLITSCQSKNGTTKEGGVLSFDSKKKITLTLDDNSSNYFMLSQEVKIENNEYLVFCNTFPTEPNLIFFNSLNNSMDSFSLDFEIEGPNGSGQMSDFYFHNFDSIFIFDRYSYKVSLMDSSGNVVNKFTLRNTNGITPEDDTVMPWLSNKSKPILNKNKLFIPVLPDLDPYHTNYSKENLLIELDLETGKFELVLGFPSKYKNKKFWGGPEHILPSIAPTSNPNEFLVSFPIEDSVFKFDINSKKLVPQENLKSSIISEIVSSDKLLKVREEVLNFQLGTDAYFSLIFDQYRNQYYRISNQKYSEESINKMLNRKAGDPNLKSLIVFDSNFEKIDEYDLPNGFSNYMFFIFESGVYAVISNEYEDKIELHNISNF